MCFIDTEIAAMARTGESVAKVDLNAAGAEGVAAEDGGVEVAVDRARRAVEAAAAAALAPLERGGESLTVTAGLTGREWAWM